MSIKALEVKPVIERISIGDTMRIQIQCIEFYGKTLYIGTTNGFIVEFYLDSKNEEEETHFICQHKQIKFLGYNKPVVALKALLSLQRIICICDSNFLILNQLDLNNINYGSILKDVYSFCLNENPEEDNPFMMQICIARKRKLQIFALSDDEMTILKEISITEPGFNLAMDGKNVCIGMKSHFAVVDWECGRGQDLCARDENTKAPLLKRIAKDEFLISGPGSLGIFVKSSGISDKPPLQWGSEIVAITYSYPYLLCLSIKELLVFSIVDQQLKQCIAFSAGCFMDNFDGTVLIASMDSIFAVYSVPWEKQVHMLLEEKKVKEALKLLNSKSANFDIVKVLELLPKEWSINMITQFLNKGLRDTIHKRNNVFIETGLVKAENNVVKYEKMVKQQKMTILKAYKSLCAQCKTGFMESDFIWYPALDLVLHVHCGRKLNIKFN